MVPARRLIPQPPESDTGWQRGNRALHPVRHVRLTASDGRVHRRARRTALRQCRARRNARPREAVATCPRRLADARLSRLQPVPRSCGKRTETESRTAKTLAGSPQETRQRRVYRRVERRCPGPAPPRREAGRETRPERWRRTSEPSGLAATRKTPLVQRVQRNNPPDRNRRHARTLPELPSARQPERPSWPPRTTGAKTM